MLIRLPTRTIFQLRNTCVRAEQGSDGGSSGSGGGGNVDDDPITCGGGATVAGAAAESHSSRTITDFFFFIYIRFRFFFSLTVSSYRIRLINARERVVWAYGARVESRKTWN